MAALANFLNLLHNQQLKLNFRLKFNFNEQREVIRYGFANTLTSLAGNLSNRIDLLMIGSLLGGSAILAEKDDFNVGLYYVTIYTIASYMATLIEMPARALSNIFLGVWVNIDSLLIFTGKDYSSGKFVFLFLALGKLINVASGVNGKIIILSKYYLIGTFLTFFLAFITFVSNLFFIPFFENFPGRVGIEGAALATALSVFLFNFLSFLFLLLKYKLQPFSFKTIIVFLVSFVSFFVVQLIENQLTSNFFFELLLKSIIVALVYIPLTYVLNLSSDFNRIVNKFFSRVFEIFRLK